MARKHSILGIAISIIWFASMAYIVLKAIYEGPGPHPVEITSVVEFRPLELFGGGFYVTAQIQAKERIDIGAVDESWLEAKLEKACIKSEVFTYGGEDYVAGAVLHMNLQVIDLEKSSYAYHISLSAIDNLYHWRNLARAAFDQESWEDDYISAQIWSESILSESPKDSFQEVITRCVDSLTGLFVDDYLAANPKDSN